MQTEVHEIITIKYWGESWNFRILYPAKIAFINDTIDWMFACILLKFIFGNPSPSNVMELGCGAFGRWWGHNSGLLMNRISSPIKKRALAVFPLWRHSKRMAVYEPGSGLLPDTECAGALILGFLSLWNCEEESYVYKLPSSMVFCYSGLNGPGSWVLM